MPPRIKYLLKTYFPVVLFITAGVAFIVIPWLMMFTFTCYRVTATQGKCIVRQTFLAIPVREIPLQTLFHAEQKGGFSGRSASYWVILITSNGTINLPSSSSWELVSNTANQINSFLADRNQKYFTVTQSDRSSGFYLGILFLGGGLVVFWIILNYRT